VKLLALGIALLTPLWGSGTLAAGVTAAAFRKLQSLAGDWEGKDEQGNMVRSNFKLIVSGTAVMETLNHSGMGEMVTFYTVDGDRIALLHFCPTNNQPACVPRQAKETLKNWHFPSRAQETIRVRKLAMSTSWSLSFRTRTTLSSAGHGEPRARIRRWFTTWLGRPEVSQRTVIRQGSPRKYDCFVLRVRQNCGGSMETTAV
jgi:hypothetical protein